MCAGKLCWKKPYLIFSIKLITGFEPWRVQSTLVVLQSLGTERKVRGSEGGQTAQLWSRSSLTSRDLQRSQNEFTRLQLVLNHDITVCWVMDCVFLTNRFSITLTSSLTWLRIFLQHSALCWILSFSAGSSVERQKTQSWGKYSFHSRAQTKAINHECIQTSRTDSNQLFKCSARVPNLTMQILSTFIPCYHIEWPIWIETIAL